MGKLYDSLLSGTSGRTGRIVVANVFGNEITRTRPRKSSAPPSEKQILIRLRMKRCADFMQSYKAYALLHFGKRVGLSSMYNLAMTNLLDNFSIDFATQSFSIHYPNIAFSRGNLVAAVPNAISLPTSKTLTVTWQNNAGGNAQRENDWVQILVAAEDETLTAFYENAAQRKDLTYTLNLPSNFEDKTLHVYIAFRDEEQETVSNSTYAGSIS